MPRNQKSDAILAYLREVAQRTAPGGREPDAYVNATTLVRMGRAMGALDGDIRADLERTVDPLTLRFAFLSADALGEPPIGAFCQVCQCYTTQPARKMSCYGHVG